MMIKNHIHGYTKDSFCDCPGFIAPVIYVYGCNLRCNFCHNKSFSYIQPKENIPFDWDIIEDDIKGKIGWYEAIVVSGGEVTIIPGIAEKLKELKDYFGLPIKIDTNGLLPTVISELLDNDIVSWVAIDIKHVWNKYKDVVGVDIDAEDVEDCFNSNFYTALKHPGKISFRTTLIPEIDENYKQMIRDQVPSMFDIIFQKYIERK